VLPTLRTALCLLTAMCLAQPVGVCARSSDTVAVVKGLVFTTTSHAGLTTGAGSVPVADTEGVYAVVGASDERIVFRFNVSAPADSSAGRLLDRTTRSFDREVRREDMRSATRLTILWNSTDPTLIPGQTFATTSSAVLRALRDAGKVAFVLGVNEPEEGLEHLAMLSFLGVSRHYYRGTLERVAAHEPFSVLLDGRRTTVPAMHVRGTFTFSNRTITPQIWWLDDADAPLTLKWTVGSVYETVTRIDRAIADEGRGTSFVDGLAGKSCRAELTGVYFTTASAEVIEASMPALERFAAVINRHPDWRVTIEGHTDNVGTAAYNLDLSTRRAEAVRDVLVRRFAVPAARVQSQGFGLTRPLESNGTDEGRAHNRRVEVSRHCKGAA